MPKHAPASVGGCGWPPVGSSRGAGAKCRLNFPIRHPSAVLNAPVLSCIVPSPTPSRREETYMFSYFDHLECSACDTTYAPTMLVNLCAFGAPLLARYRLEEAAAALDRDQLEGQTLWRYHAMLPVQSAAGVVSLGGGMTPL